MTTNDRTGAGRVLVCGGRYFDDYSFLASELDSLSPSVVIHGGARGADTLAHRWAQNHCVPIERYPADWDRYGRAAGPIRNVEMLAKSQPDVVLAFPGGDGTAHMVKIARAKGVKVTIAHRKTLPYDEAPEELKPTVMAVAKLKHRAQEFRKAHP